MVNFGGPKKGPKIAKIGLFPEANCKNRDFPGGIWPKNFTKNDEFSGFWQKSAPDPKNGQKWPKMAKNRKNRDFWHFWPKSGFWGFFFWKFFARHPHTFLKFLSLFFSGFFSVSAEKKKIIFFGQISPGKKKKKKKGPFFGQITPKMKKKSAKFSLFFRFFSKSGQIPPKRFGGLKILKFFLSFFPRNYQIFKKKKIFRGNLTTKSQKGVPHLVGHFFRFLQSTVVNKKTGHFWAPAGIFQIPPKSEISGNFRKKAATQK